jgi:hypothetical protein
MALYAVNAQDLVHTMPKWFVHIDGEIIKANLEGKAETKVNLGEAAAELHEPAPNRVLKRMLEWVYKKQHFTVTLLDDSLTLQWRVPEPKRPEPEPIQEAIVLPEEPVPAPLPLLPSVAPARVPEPQPPQLDTSSVVPVEEEKTTTAARDRAAAIMGDTRRLRWTNTPALDALIYCALKGWGATLSYDEKDQLSIIMHDFPLYYYCSIRLMARAKRTTAGVHRLNTLRQWFTGCWDRLAKLGLPFEMRERRNSDGDPNQAVLISIRRMKKLIALEKRGTARDGDEEEEDAEEDEASQEEVVVTKIIAWCTIGRTPTPHFRTEGSEGWLPWTAFCAWNDDIKDWEVTEALVDYVKTRVELKVRLERLAERLHPRRSLFDDSTPATHKRPREEENTDAPLSKRRRLGLAHLLEVAKRFAGPQQGMVDLTHPNEAQ